MNGENISLSKIDQSDMRCICDMIGDSLRVNSDTILGFFDAFHEEMNVAVVTEQYLLDRSKYILNRNLSVACDSVDYLGGDLGCDILAFAVATQADVYLIREGNLSVSVYTHQNGVMLN